MNSVCLLSLLVFLLIILLFYKALKDIHMKVLQVIQHEHIKVNNYIYMFFFLDTFEFILLYVRIYSLSFLTVSKSLRGAK